MRLKSVLFLLFVILVALVWLGVEANAQTPVTGVCQTQVPCVVARYTATGKTGSIGVTTLYTPSKDGQFMVIMSPYVSSAGSAGTVQGAIQYIPVTGATPEVYTASVNLNSISSNNTDKNYSFHQKGGSAIKFYTTVTGASGSPQYGIDITVIQLQ